MNDGGALEEGKPRRWEKDLSTHNLSTINSARNGLGLNTNLRGERPATDRLSREMLPVTQNRH